MNQKRILFVCLGNICRSPAAEGIFRSLVARRHLDGAFVIDSAAIGSWHIGDLPDPRMRRCGARHGYTFDSRARQLTSADFARFDYIIGMDYDNLRDIKAKARNAEDEKKVLLMADFLRHHDSATIPDPYYGGDRDFDHVVELLEDACETLLDGLTDKTRESR